MTTVAENGSDAATVATAIIHSNNIFARIAGHSASNGCTSPNKPEINPSIIINGTTGSASMFAGSEKNESTPVKYRSAGRIKICTAMVDAAIDLMLGTRSKNFGS